MAILELVQPRPDWMGALGVALTRPPGVPERRGGEDPWTTEAKAIAERPRRISDDLAWFRQAPAQDREAAVGVRADARLALAAPGAVDAQLGAGGVQPGEQLAGGGVGDDAGGRHGDGQVGSAKGASPSSSTPLRNAVCWRAMAAAGCGAAAGPGGGRRSSAGTLSARK
jgi:hypothetical protein